jgi:hypothetical protein
MPTLTEIAQGNVSTMNTLLTLMSFPSFVPSYQFFEDVIVENCLTGNSLEKLHKQVCSNDLHTLMYVLQGLHTGVVNSEDIHDMIMYNTILDKNDVNLIKDSIALCNVNWDIL